MPPNYPPKNPFKTADTFPKQQAQTLEQLSKSKPAYEPINFKPVPASPVKSPEEWHKLTVGSKRKAPDGTEINVFNKHLFSDSGSDRKPLFKSGKPVPKFGKTKKQISELKMQRSQASQKSNLLEPMSENASVYDDGLEIQVGNGEKQPAKSPSRSDGGDSGSEMMQFDNEQHQSDNEQMD